MVTIEPVRNWLGLRRFVDLDLRLYRDVPLYAPPIRLDVTKRLRHWTRPPTGRPPEREAALFLARRDGRLAGRVAASIDHHKNRHDGKRAGAFGFLEAEDDPAVFEALLGAAESWLAERGMDRVLGPYSFTQEDPYVGLLVEGFDLEPSFGMTYSLPYYPDGVEACGYRAVMDLKSYWCESAGDVPEPIETRAREALARPNVAVRAIDMARIWDEASVMRNLFNESLNDNWEFVPFTQDQVRGMVQELKLLADPRLILFAEVDGRPAGCVINIPDYNDVLRACRGRLLPTGFLRLLLARKDRHKFRAYALGVLRPYRRLGIAALLVYETFRRGLAAGYNKAEVTWILGSNHAMNELARRFSDARGKVHRLYEKAL